MGAVEYERDGPIYLEPILNHTDLNRKPISTDFENFNFTDSDTDIETYR